MDISQLASYGLYFTYFLLGAAVLLLLVGLVKNMLHNKKNAIMTIGAIVVIVVVYFIGSAVSSGELTAKAAADGLTSGDMKSFSGILITLYVLLFCSSIIINVDITHHNQYKS